ncbi:MAG: MoaD/ThiS family protein [Thermoplasmata archaeon]|nr:MoaD/ThiS family protein [Thermoplasmata archaeon]
MKIKLKLFASFRQAFDSSEIEYELPEGSTASDLLNDIISKHPSLERLRGHVIVTVNRNAVSLEFILNEGAEISILPPVSGG